MSRPPSPPSAAAPPPAADGRPGASSSTSDAAPPSDESERIHLPSLVSTCVDACRRGCGVIRRVHGKRTAAPAAPSVGHPRTTDGSESDAAGAASSNSGGGGSMMYVSYKVDGDPKSALTEADGASQAVILECLRRRWGYGLCIIGEEDETPPPPPPPPRGENGSKAEAAAVGCDAADRVFARYGVPTPEEEPLREDLVRMSPPASSSSSSSSPPEGADEDGGKRRRRLNPADDDGDGDGDDDEDDRVDLSLSISDVVLYVDPMDGTREFVEGRLRNVQCLIGVSCGGTPVAGVIGVPFSDSGEEEEEGKGGEEGITDSAGGGEAGGDGDGDGGGVPGEVEIVYGIALPPPPPPADDGGAGRPARSWASVVGRTSPRGGGGGRTWVRRPFFRRAPKDGDGDGDGTMNGDDTEKGGGGGGGGVTLSVLYGDSSKPDLRSALRHLRTIVYEDDPSNVIEEVIAGGCGNKILRVAMSAAPSSSSSSGWRGEAIAVVPRGTCSWDTAAPTAVLTAALLCAPSAPGEGKPAGGEKPAGEGEGVPGKVTDFFGSTLVYDGTEINVRNGRGALASCGDRAARFHDELCTRLGEEGDGIYVD